MSAEYNEYLAHHGVKGMKWGQHIFSKQAESEKQSGRREKPESKTWKAKDAGNLSDEELRRRLTRLQQEKQYTEMTASKATKARKWIMKTAGKVLVATAIGALASSTRKGYDSVLKGASDISYDSIKRESGAVQYTPKPKA